MARKAKKRGVKPGTKRGPYRKRSNKIIKGLQEAVEFAKSNDPNLWQELAKPINSSLPSIISDLASTIDTLEAQLTAQIDRIKSILI